MFKTINGFTKESMKNTILERNNGSMSLALNGACRYKAMIGTEVNRCAIGCFIPDNEYNNGIENKRVDELLDTNPQLAKHMPLEANALVILQGIHDNFDNESEHASSDVRDALCNWIDSNVKD